MSDVTVKCQFCNRLFRMERPLFKGERDQATCPQCDAEAKQNTTQMEYEAKRIGREKAHD